MASVARRLPFDRRQAERRLLVALMPLVVAASVVAAIVAGWLAVEGRAITIAFLALLALPLFLWRRPAIGMVVLVLAVTLVEQFPYYVGHTGVSDYTEQIPLFTGLSGSAGIAGLGVTPMEILLMTVVAVWLLRAAVSGEFSLPRSQLARSLGVVMLIVLVGLAVGLNHGGDLRAALIEIRPWAYLAVVYVLSSRLVTGPRALSAILWAFIIGTGVKAIQGVVLMIVTRDAVPTPEAILAHEESFFFTLFIVIAVALWVFGIKGRLRVVATALLPVVILADLGNHRRAAWLMLAVALVSSAVTAYAFLPERRSMIRRCLAVTIIAAAVYTPIFWNHEGTLGSPVRSVRAIVSPSARDDGSDQYRVLEDANLGLNIRRWSPFGAGFGVPIDYSVPIVDISNTDSLIQYVPHDGILYVWMRLGWQGMLAFWWLIAAAIFAASRLARSPDRTAAMLGTVVVGIIPAYVVLGYVDLGLYWFRVAIAMGCLLGVVEALGARGEKRTGSTSPRAH